MSKVIRAEMVLSKLDDAALSRIATRSMAGMPVDEIADIRDSADYMRKLCRCRAAVALAATAFDRLVSSKTIRHFMAPSPETLAWGGFLQGSTYNERPDEVELMESILA